MGISGVLTQQILTQINVSVAVLKSTNNAQQQLVNLVAASVDQARGQNLNISV